jgi:eukaryotic-like serine/threonine-protein kinase
VTNEIGKPRDQAPSTKLFRFGPFELDTQRRNVRKHGYRIRLSGQPLEILLLLLERPGELVSREDIQRHLWAADIFVDFERSLNSAVKKLRSALEDNAQEPRFIETQAGKGYRFIAPVQCLSSVPSAVEPMPASPASAEDKVSSVPKLSYRRWLLIAGVAVLLLVASFLWFRNPRRIAPTAHNEGKMIVRPAIAVLGFQNLSLRSDVDWLSTAFTQMLSTELAAGEKLRTVPGENITRAKRELKIEDKDGYSRDTLNALRRDLGTDFVVMGSYLVLRGKDSSQVRLDLRLQDANSGETLSSIAVSGKEAEIFDLVANAGEEIRKRLGAESPSSVIAAETRFALPSNREAIRLFSEGLARLRLSENVEARDLLKRAVTVQSDFAQAHSALAQAWSALGYDAKALASAEKAVQLAKGLPQDRRLDIEGQYFEMKHDWGGAIGVYRQLSSDHPDDLEVGLSLAKVLSASGDTESALKVINAMRNLPSPQRDDPRIDLAEAQVAAAKSDYKRQWQLGQQAASKAQAAHSELLLARAKLMQGWALDDLSQLEGSLNAYKEAQQIFVTAGDRDGTATALNDIGIVLQKQGDLQGARQKLEEAKSEFRHVGNENGFAGALTNLGEVCRVQGDLNRALALYRQAVDIFRKIGRKENEHAAMNNLGGVLYQLGNYAGAHKIFEAVLKEEQGTSDKDGVAFAQGNLADVLRVEGRLKEAKEMNEQALATFQNLGDRAAGAAIQLNLARCLLLQGDLPSARKAAEDALVSNIAIGAKGDAAVDRVLLARISLEDGHAEKFDSSVRSALDELRSEQRNDDLVDASAIEVQGLLAQGKVDEAWQEILAARQIVSSDQLAKFSSDDSSCRGRKCPRPIEEGTDATRNGAHPRKPNVLRQLQV